MALNAYLRMKGQKGDIVGGVTQKGRERSIMVIAAEHELLSPRDAASGAATGKRVHRPFVITKEIDRSTPLIYQLMITNEVLASWELQFWAPGIAAAGTGAGTEVQRYTVKLTNATINDIKFHMFNNKHPDLMRYAECEEVSFTYQRIEWLWTDGGIVAEDKWVGGAL